MRPINGTVFYMVLFFYITADVIYLTVTYAVILILELMINSNSGIAISFL